MLVLSRKQDERITLGDTIVLTVIRVAGDRVRLGIEAPNHVRVLRAELTETPTHSQAGLAISSGAAT